MYHGCIPNEPFMLDVKLVVGLKEYSLSCILIIVQTSSSEGGK